VRTGANASLHSRMLFPCGVKLFAYGCDWKSFCGGNYLAIGAGEKTPVDRLAFFGVSDAPYLPVRPLVRNPPGVDQARENGTLLGALCRLRLGLRIAHRHPGDSVKPEGLGDGLTHTTAAIAKGVAVDAATHAGKFRYEVGIRRGRPRGVVPAWGPRRRSASAGGPGYS
jgi:hypothetical protein